MSDQNTSLDIAIRMVADATGGQVTVDALKKITEEANRASEALTNTGAGLATSPAGVSAAINKGPSDPTEKEIEGMLRLEDALQRAIGAKKALGEQTASEELALEKVQAALAKYRKQLEMGLLALELLIEQKAKINADRTATEAAAAAEEKRTQAIQKSANAALTDRQEEDRRNKVLKELERNVVDETKATDKSTDSKHALRQALQGLNTEFPALGQVMKAVLSPMGLTATAAALLASRAKSYIDDVDELMARAQKFAVFGDEIDPTRQIAVGMRALQDAAARSLGDVYRSLDNVLTRLADANSELQDAERRVAMIERTALDVELARVREAVAAQIITREQGIARIEQMEIEANERRDKRLLEQKEKEFGNLQNAVFQSRNENIAAQEALDALDPQIARQRRAARLAQKNSSKEEQDATTGNTEIDKKLLLLQKFTEAGAAGDVFALGGLAKQVSGGNFGELGLKVAESLAVSAAKKLIPGSGFLSGGKFDGDIQAAAAAEIEKLQEQKKRNNERADNAAVLAEQEQTRLQSLEADRSAEVQRRNEAARNEARLKKELTAKLDDINKTKADQAAMGASQAAIAESKRQEEVLRQASGRRAELEQAAMQEFRRTGVMNPSYDYNLNTGKATMHADAAKQLLQSIDASFSSLLPALQSIQSKAAAIEAWSKHNAQR